MDKLNGIISGTKNWSFIHSSQCKPMLCVVLHCGAIILMHPDTNSIDYIPLHMKKSSKVPLQSI